MSRLVKPRPMRTWVPTESKYSALPLTQDAPSFRKGWPWICTVARVVGLHWGVGGDSNLLDAGDGVEPVFNDSIEGFHLGRRVARCLRVEMDYVPVRRVELEIDVPELIQALDKHACCDQQHQGESRLQHDEAALQE